MIEPIKPGDELFPYLIEIVDGEQKLTARPDWSDEKQVALNIRTIDYLLQYETKHGSVALINMIESYAHRAMEIGTEKQKSRFQELLDLRQSWLSLRDAS